MQPSQSANPAVPGFLAQALEEPIFHHIAPSATLPFTIGARLALPYSITSSASVQVGVIVSSGSTCMAEMESPKRLLTLVLARR
jgi:hypothetical protein